MKITDIDLAFTREILMGKYKLDKEDVKTYWSNLAEGERFKDRQKTIRCMTATAFVTFCAMAEHQSAVFQGYDGSILECFLLGCGALAGGLFCYSIKKNNPYDSREMRILKNEYKVYKKNYVKDYLEYKMFKRRTSDD